MSGSETSDEGLKRQRVALTLGDEMLAPAAPGRHGQIDDGGNRQREPAALLDLEQVGTEEGEIDGEEEAEKSRGERRVPVAHAVHIDERQHGGDAHGAGNGNAVGRAQIVGGTKADDEGDHCYHENDVHLRYKDLSDLLLRGVAQLEPRQITELHRL